MGDKDLKFISDKTTIALSKSTASRLDKYKVDSQDSYDMVLVRLLDFKKAAEVKEKEKATQKETED